MNIKRLTEVGATSGSGANLEWVNPVSGNVAWHILYGHVSLTTNATVGNRRFQLHVFDENDNRMTDSHGGATQAASLTRHYSLKQGICRETSFIDDSLEVPLSQHVIVPPGWKIQITDGNSVDLTGDSYLVNLVLNVGNLSGMQL